MSCSTSLAAGLLYNDFDTSTCDCIDPDFKPINCPTNTDSTLPTHDNFFGDNNCDGHLNTKENCFDGGDCCGKEVNTDYCYPEVGDNCDCIDPNFKPWWTQDFTGF